MLNDNLPEQVRWALDCLERAGFEAYMVGGCVRDAVMGRIPSDYDITTSARPGEVMKVFDGEKIIETGLKHGTVTLLRRGMPLEITTYRVDGLYTDNRHPESVAFTSSIREDTARRDFTINSVAFSPVRGFADFYGGVKDIQVGIIRCVGDPEKRFREDALRIIRALRFAAVTGFEIEEATFKAACENSGLLRNISVERIREELVKLLCGQYAGRVLKKGVRIIGEVIPEVLPMVGFPQHNRHHIYDVWEHTVAAVDAAPQEKCLRLAALFHDIGKPGCFSVDEKGVGHFYGHAAVSEEITANVMSRLKFDKETKSHVRKLVACHDMQIEPTAKAVRRAMNKLSPDILYDLLKLKRADNMAQSPQYRDRQKYYDEIRLIADEILKEEQCFSLKDLTVNGSDLIRLGVPQGPQVGIILQELLQGVIDGELPNKRTVLEEKILQNEGLNAKKY